MNDFFNLKSVVIGDALEGFLYLSIWGWCERDIPIGGKCCSQRSHKV